MGWVVYLPFVCLKLLDSFDADARQSGVTC